MKICQRLIKIWKFLRLSNKIYSNDLAKKKKHSFEDLFSFKRERQKFLKT